MVGKAARAFGRFAEGLSFQGDSSALNPMRYLGSPALSKLWQNRTPLEQYLSNEVVGTRMRRWHRPLHDMANVYARGVVKRTTGQILVPEDVQRRRDLNTLSDVMQYLRTERQTRSPRPGEQQKARAGAGDDRHIYQFGTPRYKSARST